MWDVNEVFMWGSSDFWLVLLFNLCVCRMNDERATHALFVLHFPLSWNFPVFGISSHFFSFTFFGRIGYTFGLVWSGLGLCFGFWEENKIKEKWEKNRQRERETENLLVLCSRLLVANEFRILSPSYTLYFIHTFLRPLSAYL